MRIRRLQNSSSVTPRRSGTEPGHDLDDWQTSDLRWSLSAAHQRPFFLLIQLLHRWRKLSRRSDVELDCSVFVAWIFQRRRRNDDGNFAQVTCPTGHVQPSWLPAVQQRGNDLSTTTSVTTAVLYWLAYILATLRQASLWSTWLRLSRMMSAA